MPLVSLHNRKHGLIIAFFVLCLSVIGLMLDPTGLVTAQGPSSSDPVQLQLFQSDATQIVMELDVDKYTTRPANVGGVNYVDVSIANLGSSGEAGKPQLPVKGTMIGVPPGAQVSLSILADDSQRTTLSAPVMPIPTERVQRNLKDQLPHFAGMTYVTDPTIYSASRVYPAQVADIAFDGNWRSQRFLTVQFHPLQYNPVTRELIFHRRVRVQVTLSYPRGQTREAVGGVINEGSFESVLQQSLLNYSSAKNWRAKPTLIKPSASKPTYSGGPWYRIAIDRDGMYKVTCPQLQAAGVDIGSLVTDTLKVYKQASETATLLVWPSGSCDSQHYILFWGQGISTTYTTTNYYWLTFGGSNGKRMAPLDGSGSAAAPEPFVYTQHLEQDTWYLSNYPIPFRDDVDHWFWNYVLDGGTDDFPFQITNLSAGSISPTLRVKLNGYTSGNHHTYVRVNANSTPVIDTNWSGQDEQIVTGTFPISYLNNGTNTLHVSESSSGSILFINNFDVSYTRNYTATSDSLRFTQPVTGTWQFQVTGFTTSTIGAFDMTDPWNISQVVTKTIAPSSGTYTLSFVNTLASSHEYVTLAPSQYKTPASIARAALPDLTSASNAADEIIISYGAFITNVQPLANFRVAQGLRVRLIDVQDVYDAFNDGVMDPQAIRSFLVSAYSNWNQSPAPSMVLLVGDATLDPKGNCVGSACSAQGYFTTPNSTFLPAFLRNVDPWISETASDNRFVSFNDSVCNPTCNTMPQMAIGRLPVNNTSEVDVVVNKLKNYESVPPSGAWRSRVAFVTGDPYYSDGSADSTTTATTNFWTYSDEVASNPLYMPPSLTADRLYYNPCDPNVYGSKCQLPYPPYTTESAIQTAIISAFNNGHLIVNYIGHGAAAKWGSNWGETFFSDNIASTLSNGNLLPIMLDMTCYTGYFIHPNTSTASSLGEVALRKANGGAVASWSATGEGVTSGHDYLDRGFFSAVVNQNVRQLGAATLAGKLNLWTNDKGDVDLLDTFVLLGDPATRLQIQFPTYLPLIYKAASSP